MDDRLPLLTSASEAGDGRGVNGLKLELTNVRKSLGAFVLGPLSVVLAPGVTALLGANGAGKTTFMRLLVGALRPTAGVVTLQRGGQPLRAGGAGYLPQDFVGPKNVRVADYLRYVAWARSRRGNALGEVDVHRALAAVGLQERARDRFGTLSGGMVRRVGIAQALVGGDGLLVLDEPTVGLDPVQRREVRELIRGLGSEAAVVLSTHLSEDVAAIADRVVVLDGGAVVHEGSVDSLVAIGGGDDRSGESVERGFLAVLEEAGR